MMQDKLVSVIVPIYNIEAYLDRCVKSIVEQKYKNLEIILVDDGSSDSSGIIADKWKEKDSRIIVIHRENGGLSAARNSGIDMAHGEYLVFVDSDDWISPDLIYAAMQKSNEADLICFGAIQVFDNHESFLPWFNEEKIISQEEALDFLVQNQMMTSHVMTKVYARKLFDGIRFPEGKVFEDIRIVHKIFLKTNNVYILDKAYYYYFVREDSISNMVKLQNRIEWYEALEDRYKDVRGIKEDYKDIIASQMAVVISLAMVQNTFSDEEKKAYSKKILEIKAFLRKKTTSRAVKKYATFQQYIYYSIAKYIGFKANNLYKLFR